MKIKTQFYLLVTGIIIIPILLFSGITIYMQFFSGIGVAREVLDELRELAGLPDPPIIMRFLPFFITSVPS